MGLAIAWLVHRRVVGRRSQPLGSLRKRLPKPPTPRKLHEEDVTFVLEKDGQPRLLGEGTFGKVLALQLVDLACALLRLRTLLGLGGGGNVLCTVKMSHVPDGLRSLRSAMSSLFTGRGLPVSVASVTPCIAVA